LLLLTAAHENAFNRFFFDKMAYHDATFKQWAILAPCFVIGLAGALFLTAPQAVVQNNANVRAAAVAVAAAAVANPVMAAPSNIDVLDYRSQKDGIEITYQARDLDLDQNTRDGFTQARSPAVAKARISESVARLSKVGDFINKAYWTKGREELRGQVGTLRFDINTLAATTSAEADKKAILAAKADLLSTIDKLDFAMRKKDQTSAAKIHSQVVAKASALSKF